MKKSELVKLLRGTQLNRMEICFAALLSVGSAIVLLYLPLQARVLIDDFQNKFNLRSIIAIIITLVVQALLSSASFYILSVLAQKVVRQIRNKVSTHLLLVKESNLGNDYSGELASSVITNTQTINGLLSNLFPDIVNGLTATIGALIFLFIMSWQLTLVVFGALILLMLVLTPISNINSKAYEDSQAKTNNLIGKLTNYFSQNRLIKSVNAQNETAQEVSRDVESLYVFGLKIAKISALLGPLILTLLMATFLVIFGFGGYLVTVHSITIGTLISFLLFVFQIMTPVANVGNTINEIQAANGASKHLNELLELETEVFTGIANFELANNEITFNNVDFSYGDKDVLRAINLAFGSNKLTALAGPSGGGKSTIISLLERFYEPSSGQIKLGEVDVTDLNLSEWRRKIGYVPQATSVVGKTIREVLLLGIRDKNVTNGELESALKQAYLFDFVESLPDGLETQLNENSTNLSGGQVQRLMLARALLRKPEFLILDEFTSALDGESEQFIKESINNLRSHLGIVIVAHRLSTIKDADQIYFIDEGRVAGSGTYESLIETLPTYKAYVKEQQV